MVITIRKKPISILARHIDEFVESGRDLMSIHQSPAEIGVEAADLASAQQRFVKAHADVSGLRRLLDAGEEFSRGYDLVSEVTAKGAPETSVALAEKTVTDLYDKLGTALDEWPAEVDDDEVEHVGEVSIALSPEDMYDLLEAGVLTSMDVVNNWEHGDLAQAVNELETWARNVAEKLGVNLTDDTEVEVEHRVTRDRGGGSSPAP